MRTEQMPPLLRHRVALFLPFSTCDHFEQLVSDLGIKGKSLNRDRSGK